jgi:hypothetical protein
MIIFFTFCIDASLSMDICPEISAINDFDFEKVSLNNLNFL